MFCLLVSLFQRPRDEPPTPISLVASVSYFYDDILQSGDSIAFTVSPGRPFSLLFHQTDKFDIKFDSSRSRTLRRRVNFNQNTPSTFLSFPSSFLIESFTITALASQSLSFSYFAVDPHPQSFVTNRQNGTFSFWNSFPSLKCSPASDVWLFLNLTNPYRVFSEKSAQFISDNSTALIESRWTGFQKPSVIHFTKLSCADNFTLFVEGDSPQTDPVFEFAVSESEIDFDVSDAVVHQESQSEAVQILIGLAVILLAFAAVVILVAVRGHCRNARLAWIGPKSRPTQVNTAAVAPAQGLAPDFARPEAEVEEAGLDCQMGPKIGIDPYHLDPGSGNVVDGREDSAPPDSPYDLP
jgi:hypothetical protein